MKSRFLLRKSGVRLYPLAFLLLAVVLLSPAVLVKTAHANVVASKVNTDTTNAQTWKSNDDFVNTMYKQVLGRSPDTDGYNGWVDRLNHAATSGGHVALARQAASTFFTGDEYAARNRTDVQYVDDLYNGILQRTPDAAGEAGWVANLTDGTSRADVLSGFVRSGEFVDDASRLVTATTFTVPAIGPNAFTYTAPDGQIINSAVILTPAGQTFYDPSDKDNEACASSLSSSNARTVVAPSLDTDENAGGSCTYSFVALAVQCTMIHLEIDKRNGEGDEYTFARYIMNKKFCYDGTNVTQSDAADVRGFVIPSLALVYEFKGNYNVQNGSSVNGSSTAQGNFASPISASLPAGFTISDLGYWQPSLTIVPHGDGSYDYAPLHGDGSRFNRVRTWRIY